MALSVNLDKLNTVLDTLIEGDLIEIHWCDASKNHRAKKIDNKLVACYKKQTGCFIQYSYDLCYGIEHILLEDLNEGEVIWSIPRPVITHAQKIGRKPVKEMSDVGTPFLGGKDLKIYQREGGIGRVE